MIISNKDLFNKIAKYYDRSLLGSWLKSIQKKAVGLIEIKNNSKILDVGSGPGNLLKILLDQNKNLELQGVDISEKMLEIARKKLGSKVILKLEPAEKMNFPPDYFDYIFSAEAFHHFEKPDAVMKDCYRFLKNDGTLMIVDVDFSRYLNWFFHLIEPGNKKTYTKKEFKKLFEEYNFKEIRQKRIDLFFVATWGRK